jgi:uncharacterized membrane protein
MDLKVWELISIMLAALVAGVFWGPWVGLTRSIATFNPEAFLAIGDRLNQNLEPLMTVLMPTTLLSMVPVLLASYNSHPRTFYSTLAALVLFVVALLVTVVIEVPIAKQIKSWTLSTLPDNWQQLRDRWASVHIIRVVSGLVGLALLVAGALYA